MWKKEIGRLKGCIGRKQKKEESTEVRELHRRKRKEEKGDGKGASF